MFDEHYRRVNGVCTNNSRVALRVRVRTSTTNSTERVLSSILFSNDRAFPSFLPLNMKKACAISPSAQFSLSVTILETLPGRTKANLDGFSLFAYRSARSNNVRNDRLGQPTTTTRERLVERRRRTNANPFLFISAE